jgi:hypothetical protein
MPTTTRLCAAALATVLVATLAFLPGCGGGGGDGGQLTKSEFLAKGDEICRHGSEQYAELQKDPPKTSEETAELTQKLIEITRDEVVQIRDLDAPDDVQPALNRYLRAREQGLEILEKGFKAAASNDARAYVAAQAKMAAGQVERLKLAQAVGFSECSRPAGSASGE